MGDQILDELRVLDQEAADSGRPPYLGGSDNFLAATWLAKHLYAQIGATVSVAKKGMDWLKAAGRAISAADLPLWWTTPAGLPVLQRYTKQAGRTVETTFRGKRLQLQLDDDAGPTGLADWLDQGRPPSMDGKKVGNGIVPNFVHALDAAHLMLCVNAAHQAGIADLAVIHDSFGTHAADTDLLSAILRESFVDMYARDPLAQFRSELLRQLADHPTLAEMVPPIPEGGKLDFRSVLDATYMFA
jgi:DNA-directed RNA polymerase